MFDDLATELGTPQAMYEFVRNEFEFQPYYGSRKGSVETLHQRAGNDYDLASLLIALLRASGTPARYAEGQVEMTLEESGGRHTFGDYAEDFLAMELLIELAGEDALRRFYRLLVRGLGFKAALQQLTKLDWSAFGERALEHARTRLSSFRDPGLETHRRILMASSKRDFQEVRRLAAELEEEHPSSDFVEYARDLVSRHWEKGVEILLIAAVIYALLLMLRSTRGAGMLRGLAVLVGFAVVLSGVRYLGLLRITWLLERLFAISAVALVVIFQPELRRMLVRLGQTRWLGFMGRPRSVALSEVISAVASMSKRKIGALIAIEREVGLRQVIEGGTRLNSEITSELLGSIFYPNAPLHDGGVVIRINRVAAAGCLFPLSENPKLQKELGTRHRAAVGMSEETDAAVIVVSEETGTISVSYRGRLSRGLEEARLRRFLSALLLRGKGAESAWRRAQEQCSSRSARVMAT